MPKDLFNRNAVKFGKLHNDIRVGNLASLLPMDELGMGDSKLACGFAQTNVGTLAKFLQM